VAREIVGIGELTYAGNHGYELLPPGEDEARPAPELRDVAGDAAAYVMGLDGAELDAAGIRVEDKGPIVALHWRGAPDESAAEALTESVAADAFTRGLDVHRGRMVLEVRPRVQLDKGTAVAALITESGASAALYAGDDHTDLDAFTALDRLREAGDLEVAVRVGVRSSEGPAEIVSAADVVVDGPDALPALLEHLAG
jgi:trehalose 6-phosphate phosphatase